MLVRIAIADFQGRVAPRLEETARFVLVEVRGGRVVQRQTLGVEGPFIPVILDFLVQNKVDLVLCGSLAPQTFFLLQNVGINVLWGVVGGIDEAISSFLAGVFPYPPPARKRWRWGKNKKWR